MPTSQQKSPEEPSAESSQQRGEILRGVVENLLTDLRNGSADKDKRRPVEEWLKSLAEKYPDFAIEQGLRDYYLAEASRLRVDFDAASDLSEKLAIGRSVESFLERAADYERRIAAH